MRKLRLVLAGAVAVSTMWVAAPAVAEECLPDDATPCCETTADKANAASRKLTGQDLLYCTQ